RSGIFRPGPADRQAGHDRAAPLTLDQLPDHHGRPDAGNAEATEPSLMSAVSSVLPSRRVPELRAWTVFILYLVRSCLKLVGQPRPGQRLGGWPT
ncbi:MAG TPA: hypothetical protein VF070_24385, partial [Streptosporangiaceae bacterium]